MKPTPPPNRIQPPPPPPSTGGIGFFPLARERRALHWRGLSQGHLSSGQDGFRLSRPFQRLSLVSTLPQLRGPPRHSSRGFFRGFSRGFSRGLARGLAGCRPSRRRSPTGRRPPRRSPRPSRSGRRFQEGAPVVAEQKQRAVATLRPRSWKIPLHEESRRIYRDLGSSRRDHRPGPRPSR
jgi:hypothetical protein